MGADLTITGLIAGYGRSRVVSGLDLGPLAGGTVTTLVGPNAAGKSTLLKALVGLVPAAGSAKLGDVDLLALGPRARAGHFGYLPQTLPAATGLTVLEAVIVAFRATGAAAQGTDPARRAMQALDGLGVADLAGRALDRLSGGQRQLVGLAAALVREPPLVLLDEPTSALDLFHQVRVMEASKALAANGRVVVAVLHDLTLAARWSDRIVVLQGGRIAADGPPTAAITPEMLALVYGVAGRVEPCSGGFPQVILDGRLASPSSL